MISLATVALIGCGGGGGGGAVSIVSDNESPDPVALDIAIAYVKRPIPLPDQDSGAVSIDNIANPIEMFSGARLLVRPRSSNLAPETDITDQIIAIVAADQTADPDLMGLDIKDLETSFDGSTLIFSVRAIPDIDNNDEPELFTWNIWTYDFETGIANYLIDSALIRDEGAAFGGGHDIAPHFLTDDRIVFSSSRQSAIQEKQLNEGRGQRYSAVSENNRNTQAVALHTYNPDNGKITQISLNRSIDLDPTTLESGEIVFSRWNGRQQISLYQINPSGTQVSALYGRKSGELVGPEESQVTSEEENNNRVHFLHPREMPDGRLLTFIRPQTQTHLGGDFAFIDTRGFVELFTPVNDYQGDEQRAQTPLTDLEINALDELSPGGKFLAAYPLKDGTNRVLTSWSSCRIENADGLIKPCKIASDDDRVLVGETLQLQAAPPSFGLWVYNPQENTQLPVVLAQAGFVISEVVAAEPRSFPSSPNEDDIIDNNLAAENKGRIIIDSVYNEDDGLVAYAQANIAAYAEPGTTTYTNRPARFLRIIQPVPIPNDDVLDNMPSSGGRYDMLEILGYIPVEPDGSVSAKVPANTPIMISVVNADGRRISRRHSHWLQVSQGETLHCVGCHNPDSPIPHGRLDSQPPSLNPGAVSLNTGLEGFIATDPTLFASELGETMAEVYNQRKPDTDPSNTVRDLQLQLSYRDEWTDTAAGLTADPDINVSYDPSWTIPTANAIISPNLDPELEGRIVINYNDHIQAIWDRERQISQDGQQVIDSLGQAVTNCTGCHTTNGDTKVAAGQLDLTNGIFDGIFTRSYLDLSRNDNEQWLTDTGQLADRQRLCTETDEQGVVTQTTLTFTVRSSVNRGSALASDNFFNCFEVDNSAQQCGSFVQDTSVPPANCTDSGGTLSVGGALITKTTPATFSDAQALMAAALPPLSLTTAPELMAVVRSNCAGCHSSTAPANNRRTPYFADSDDATAYAAITAAPYINLVNPAASILTTRLSVLNHNCSANGCDADAIAMQQAIERFANAVPATEVITPGGTPVAPGSFNHYQLLSPSEKRLISEWLDTGSAFFNDPFDPRLYQ